MDPSIAARREAAGQAAFLGGLFAAGAILALTALKIPLLCPLRLSTKVPCPLCGMTTGTVAMMKGRVSAAFEANPLSLFFVPVAAALFVERSVRALRPPARPINIPVRQWLVWLGVGIVLAASWLYQLMRFGFI